MPTGKAVFFRAMMSCFGGYLTNLKRFGTSRKPENVHVARGFSNETLTISQSSMFFC